ncbi:hypothetical protein [Rahnella inusitata]|uniref:hypothetical protein n=1 Tax=Rahnella inusitata TaxID=58169 RepID=UPI0039AFCEE2
MTKKEFFLQAYIAALAGNPINQGIRSCGVTGSGGPVSSTQRHVLFCSFIADAATKEVEDRGFFKPSEEDK